VTLKNDSTDSCLYLVGTPIGNLGDMTFRAVEILKNSDSIACEDTRNARKLMERFEIKTKLFICHDHNEGQVASQIADSIEQGQTISLISDAGMPAISDPGFRVVRECRKRGIKVVPIPGPCAAITALAASGLPSDRFHFVGFLPPKKAARLRNFEALKDNESSLIFYESTHRILKFLDDAIEVFGKERWISMGRELTKLHETILTGTLGHVREELNTRSTKGEFVVIIAKKEYTL